MVAPVEPPVALFQKPRNTVLGDSVEAAHMPLGLILHILNSVDRMTYLLTNMLPCLNYSTHSTFSATHLLPCAVGYRLSWKGRSDRRRLERWGL